MPAAAMRLRSRASASRGPEAWVMRWVPPRIAGVSLPRASVRSAGGGPDPLHDVGGAQSLDERDGLDAAAVALHQLRADDRVERVVAALDQHVGADRLDQRLGRV